MYNNIPTKAVTGEVRLTYCNLVQPRVNNNDPTATPKYSTTILIPKSDVATLQNINQSIEAAAAAAQGKIWNGVRPPNMPVPIHDGDNVRQDGTPYGEECRGHWVITASSKQKPVVCHQSDVYTELLPQDIYSGMYARVILNFFGYAQAGKKGVGCGLNGVMKTRDGEQLAGNGNAAADFAAIMGVPTPPPAFGATPPPPAYSAPPAYNPQPQASNGYNENPPWVPQQGAINPLTGQPYNV
jgi:hypothetical protein